RCQLLRRNADAVEQRHLLRRDASRARRLAGREVHDRLDVPLSSRCGPVWPGRRSSDAGWPVDARALGSSGRTGPTRAPVVLPSGRGASVSLGAEALVGVQAHGTAGMTLDRPGPRAESSRPRADVRDLRGLLLDMDGVLYRGDTALPG